MSQISPPIRILLVAVIGLVAVYMLFLKPKDPVAPVAAVPAPATTSVTPVPAKDPGAVTQSKPGAIVQGAVRDTQAASANADAAAGGAVTEQGGVAVLPSTPGSVNTNPTTQVPAPGAAAQPAGLTKSALAHLPKSVRGAVRDRKVTVLLFYNNRSYDDRAVRRELDKVDRRNHQVFVDAHWIKSVARFQAITRGADVQQSPTVVVTDSNLKAETLVGFVDHETIDQAVVDAISAGGGSLVRDPYLRQIDSLCVSSRQQVKALGQPATAAALPTYLQGALAVSVSSDAKFAAVKAPSKWKTFDKRFLAFNATNTSIFSKAAAQAKAHPAKARGILKRAVASSNRAEHSFVARNGRHGLTCF